MRMRNVAYMTAMAGLLIGSATQAEAYLGPGAGLSAIGSVVSVISAVFLAIAGFIWYPIKRLFKRAAPAAPVEAVELGDGLETGSK
ncbi:MAG TPA: hypothetical protein VHU23_14685 [Rhizomicrobium sp.]|jgi:hypothetical protein|nr:hypothetical protein [Rhizomicrobium sp.]